ncbi:MAG: glutamate ABC transporter permease [Hoeflea sp. BRH_c9]|nr:MAG: glutamate ABC transporter permease [Hoeflea sp. BRH_c9]
MNYSWNWGILFEAPYAEWLLSGVAWTIGLFAASMVVGFGVGTGIGLMRIAPIRWLRIISGIYVEMFRNVPLLVQIFIWFYVMPELLPSDVGQWLKRDLPMPAFWTSVVAIGFYTAARVAEHIRAGFLAIPAAQMQAALATGLNLRQVYRYVLLPRAFRIVTPALTSEAISVMKNTSLALTIGVLELMAQSRQIESYTFQSFEAFTAGTAIYIALCAAVVFVARHIEARYAIPGMIQSR